MRLSEKEYLNADDRNGNREVIHPNVQRTHKFGILLVLLAGVAVGEETQLGDTTDAG